MHKSVELENPKPHSSIYLVNFIPLAELYKVWELLYVVLKTNKK